MSGVPGVPGVSGASGVFGASGVPGTCGGAWPFWRQAGVVVAVAVVLSGGHLGLRMAMGWSLPAWSVGPMGEAVAGEGEVLVADALRLPAGSVVWLDARPLADYEAGHIPGALPLNEGDWEAGLSAVLEHWLPGSGQVLVVYCSSQRCDASHAVAARLTEELGGAEVVDVAVLHGGWSAWQAHRDTAEVRTGGEAKR